MSNITNVNVTALALEVRAEVCHPYVSILETSYGYYPSFAAGVVFCVLFALPTIYNVFRSIQFRAATSILLALGAFTELIGWGARAFNGKCPYNRDAFMAQEVTLIIAPVFFSAVLYVLLGKLIVDLGPASSILTARWYAIIFCTCDVASLVVQAVGGAKASMADTDDEMNMGTHIMVGGIGFQLLTMTLFGGLVADFMWRVFRDHSAHGLRSRITPGVGRVLVAMLVSFLMVYVRSVYRTVELSQGWNGYLITHEPYFIGLDASIMVVAVAVFAFADPAVVLRREGWSRFGGSGAGATGKAASNSDVEVGYVGQESHSMAMRK